MKRGKIIQNMEQNGKNGPEWINGAFESATDDASLLCIHAPEQCLLIFISII